MPVRCASPWWCLATLFPAEGVQYAVVPLFATAPASNSACRAPEDELWRANRKKAEREHGALVRIGRDNAVGIPLQIYANQTLAQSI